VVARNILGPARGQFGTGDALGGPHGFILISPRCSLAGSSSMKFHADLTIDYSKARRRVDDKSDKSGETDTNKDFPSLRLRH